MNLSFYLILQIKKQVLACISKPFSCKYKEANGKKFHQKNIVVESYDRLLLGIQMAQAYNSTMYVPM